MTFKLDSDVCDWVYLQVPVPDGKMIREEGFPSGPASGYQFVSLSKSISHKNRLFLTAVLSQNEAKTGPATVSGMSRVAQKAPQDHPKHTKHTEAQAHCAHSVLALRTHLLFFPCSI